MPFDTISEARLEEVHPEVSRRAHQLEQMADANGVIFRVTRGLASFNEQMALYAQGRETLAQVNERRAAVHWAPITAEQNLEIVTHARPELSMHVYGLAIDIVPGIPDISTFQPDWKEQDPWWGQLLAWAIQCGFSEGAQWTAAKRDYPHLYPNELDANPTADMQQALKDAGVQGVWQILANENILPLAVSSSQE